MITKTENQRRTEKAVRIRKERGNYKANQATGVMHKDEVLTLQAFCSRMGCTASNVIDMRRRGLIVREDGGRLKVSGEDYLNYVNALPVAKLKNPSVG